MKEEAKSKALAEAKANVRFDFPQIKTRESNITEEDILYNQKDW